MLIIPAIDLEDGCVVRYVQGKLNKKVYSRDPLKVAQDWVKQGAKLIHLVDLNGAFSGKPKNLDIVKKIAGVISVPIEFGGGIRDIKTINNLIDYGVRRVVLGTKAVLDRLFLKKIFSKFKDRVIVSLDAKQNKLLVKGWKTSNQGIGMIDFANSLKQMGFKELIYTDTLKDGTLSGPNVSGIKNLLKATSLKIIASGGVSSLKDISKLKKLEQQGLTGLIVGKALYEGKFTLAEALKLERG
ncbi:MAG: 1-(5-phosphoribosyl)-5-[(5-phosphoribosylamino)methylideneamino]imidazole-4-carboxamide isomerase [Candidatus Omnitrophota bacterium]